MPRLFVTFVGLTLGFCSGCFSPLHAQIGFPPPPPPPPGGSPTSAPPPPSGDAPPSNPMRPGPMRLDSIRPDLMRSLEPQRLGLPNGPLPMDGGRNLLQNLQQPGFRFDPVTNLIPRSDLMPNAMPGFGGADAATINNLVRNGSYPGMALPNPGGPGGMPPNPGGGAATLPGSNLTMTPIPGGNLVRLSAPGSPLSLDLPIGRGMPNGLNASAPSLPGLLTGGNVPEATRMVANGGQIQLRSGGPNPGPGGMAPAGGLATTPPGPGSPMGMPRAGGAPGGPIPGFAPPPGGFPSLPQGELRLASLESRFTGDYARGMGIATPGAMNFADTRSILTTIATATQVKPALVYISFLPSGQANLPTAGQDDELEIVLITGRGNPIRKRLSGVTRKQVMKLANEFRKGVTDLRGRHYFEPAQALYQVLIAPIAPDLQSQQVNNIVFIVEQGLRSLPFAALYDGQQFLIEQYSIGLMPSLSLTDTTHVSLRNASVLAMGVSQFKDQLSLPSVPQEIDLIANKLWTGRAFLNETFTLTNLQTQRQQQPFQIVHLATHGEFKPGLPQESYIQLWDTQLKLNQIRQLNWSNPPVELLVLSACRTAIGDSETDFGFAGLSVQAGVKATLASLWYVSDVGTLALMNDFYRQMKETSTKAEALRNAQIAMVRGKIYVEGEQIRTRGLPATVALPPELQAEQVDLSHPYYWAAFTMIGNPW